MCGSFENDGSPHAIPCSLTPEERKEAQRRLTAPNAASIHGKWTGGKHAKDYTKESSLPPSQSKLSPADRKEAQRRLLFTTYAFDASKWTGPRTEHNSNISANITNSSISSLPPRSSLRSTPQKESTSPTPHPQTDEERIRVKERLFQPTQAYIARISTPVSGKSIGRVSTVTPLVGLSTASADSYSNQDSNVDTAPVLSPSRTPRPLTTEERREARERLQQPTTAWSSRTGDITNRLITSETTQQSILTPEERREARERLSQNTVSTSNRVVTPLASIRSTKHFFPDPIEVEGTSSELVSQSIVSQDIIASEETIHSRQVEEPGIEEKASNQDQDTTEMY